MNTVVAKVEPTALERWRRPLERTAADLRDGMPRVAINAPLVPVDVCRQTVAEYRDLKPMGERLAVGWVAKLVRAYPGQKLSEDETRAWLEELRDVFAEHPDAVAAAAVVVIKKRLRFRPLVADVEQAFNEQRGRAASLAIAARAHLDERERRAAAARHDAEVEAGRATVMPKWASLIASIGKYTGPARKGHDRKAMKRVAKATAKVRKKDAAEAAG